MKIIIIGNGRVGFVLSKLLLREKDIESITCCDVKSKKRARSKKISYEKLDASRKSELLKLMKNSKADIVVNASLPMFNVNIIESCLENRINYMDLNSFWDFDPNPRAKIPYQIEQLEYDKRFKQRGLLGLINAGVSPGLTNLLARQAADFLDKIDSLKIRLFEDTGSQEMFFTWSKKWMLDEAHWRPLVYRNKIFKLEDIFSGEENYRFPKPYGTRKVFLVSQEEAGTIPLFVPTRNLDIKSFDNQLATLKLLLQLGLLSEKKIKAGKTTVVPHEIVSEIIPDSPAVPAGKNFENGVFGLVVEAIGKKDGRSRSIRQAVFFPIQKEINKLNLEANIISYPAALMAGLFISAFDLVKGRGIILPESLGDNARKKILNDLEKKYNVKIKKIIR